MKKFLLALTAALAFLLLGACSNSSSNASSSEDKTTLSSMPDIDGITYYGDIPENPTKVVNFAYSYTGYLLQLGIDVSSYSLDMEKDSPAFGDELEDAVQLTTSDTEAIAAENPDLIIVFSGDDNLETLKEIAPVIEIEYGVHDYLQMMTDFGQIFGKEDEAQEWLDSWNDKVTAAKKELSPYLSEDTTFTVMDIFDKGIYLYGQDFGRGSELVYMALGYASPTKVEEDVFPTGWLGISQEALPDYVGDYLLVNVNDSTQDSITSLEESDVWKNLPSVQDGHALEVDYNLFYFSDPMSLDMQIDAFVDAIKKANS